MHMPRHVCRCASRLSVRVRRSEVRGRGLRQPQSPPSRVRSSPPHGMPRAVGCHTAGIIPAGGGWSAREERQEAAGSSSGRGDHQPGGATSSGRTADTGAGPGESHHDGGSSSRGSHRAPPCVKCDTPGACEAVAHACYTLRAAKSARNSEAGERIVQELVQAGHRRVPQDAVVPPALLRWSPPQPLVRLTPHPRLPLTLEHRPTLQVWTLLIATLGAAKRPAAAERVLARMATAGAWLRHDTAVSTPPPCPQHVPCA